MRRVASGEIPLRTDTRQRRERDLQGFPAWTPISPMVREAATTAHEMDEATTAALLGALRRF